jgi:hypothetical protein
MAIPRVFVSSTYYDLKYIRENLKYFVRTLGYEPALSEDGDVFFNPKKHTHDSCITEVPSCQLFVLIIGGRFGGKFKDSDKSITNIEYLEALKSKIPVFALVENSVYAEHHVYTENLKRSGQKTADAIKYPSVDNIRVFHFIDEVRKYAVNNAIVPFRDFVDIESYLKKQWAGMMFSFLTEVSEEARISDTLSVLTSMSERIELLSSQILDSVGSQKAIVTTKLYELMMDFECYRDLRFINIKASPKDILKAESYAKLGKKFGVEIRVDKDASDDESFSVTSSGEFGSERLKYNEDAFLTMKGEMQRVLREHRIKLMDFLKDDKNGSS